MARSALKMGAMSRKEQMGRGAADNFLVVKPDACGPFDNAGG
jgi:hypothetical protein